jgi:hypothetical protein
MALRGIGWVGGDDGRWTIDDRWGANRGCGKYSIVAFEDAARGSDGNQGEEGRAR